MVVIFEPGFKFTYWKDECHIGETQKYYRSLIQIFSVKNSNIC